MSEPTELAHVSATIESATTYLRAGQPIIWDNGPVYALVGDANDPQLQEKFQAIKGEIRGIRQPVGWTVPFSHAIDSIAVDGLASKPLRELFRDPDKLTRLIGGYAFIRATADMATKASRQIPDAIIANEPNATVQIYSPVGMDITYRLARTAIIHGMEPVMTSANTSGKQPEIITAAEVQRFAKRGDTSIPVFTQIEDAAKPQRPLGSYPVIRLTADGFELPRSGCFDPRITWRLLEGYPRQPLSQIAIQTRYPDNMLRLEDLPRSLRALKGTELWEGLLKSQLRWHQN